jgi:CheY-like chemotaxis protein
MSSTRTVNKLRVVLIVEDDAELRRMWRIALSVEGFEVEEAGDGIDALQHLEQRAPDLIVLDLGLPRLSGFSVRQEIAAHAVTRQIPIVVVTGSTMDLGHLDVSCVLRKPVTPEELIAAVESCIPFRAGRASDAGS